jgi:hypothetical protein
MNTLPGPRLLFTLGAKPGASLKTQKQPTYLQLTMEDEKALVLETISSLLTLANTPGTSLSDYASCVLPESFILHTTPHHTPHTTFAAQLSHPRTIREDLTDPTEVWVHEKIALAWTGCSLSKDGATVKKGINAFTLFKVPDREGGGEGGEKWKIAGVADAFWDSDTTAATPTVSDTITPAMLAPINVFLSHLRKFDFPALKAMLVPEGGMSHSAANEPIQHVLFPAFVDILHGIMKGFPAGVDVNEKIFDVEGRVCGDMAVVWTPFVVEFDGMIRKDGVNIWWLVRKGEEWVIAGIQDWGKAV